LTHKYDQNDENSLLSTFLKTRELVKRNMLKVKNFEKRKSFIDLIDNCSFFAFFINIKFGNPFDTKFSVKKENIGGNIRF